MIQDKILSLLLLSDVLCWYGRFEFECFHLRAEGEEALEDEEGKEEDFISILDILLLNHSLRIICNRIETVIHQQTHLHGKGSAGPNNCLIPFGPTTKLFSPPSSPPPLRS